MPLSEEDWLRYVIPASEHIQAQRDALWVKWLNEHELQTKAQVARNAGGA